MSEQFAKELGELTGQVRAMNIQLEKLATRESMESIRNDLSGLGRDLRKEVNDINNRMSQLQTQQAATDTNQAWFMDRLPSFLMSLIGGVIGALGAVSAFFKDWS